MLAHTISNRYKPDLRGLCTCSELLFVDRQHDSTELVVAQVVPPELSAVSGWSELSVVSAVPGVTGRKAGSRAVHDFAGSESKLKGQHRFAKVGTG